MTDRSTRQIAEKLRRIRQDKHMTQEDIASKAGISTNYYARIERVEVKPSVETFEKVVKALGVKSSDVLPF